jgi:hypothetical protein
LGIRRALAAVFFSSLFFVTSVGVARADPGFTLVEAEARAGDLVHFSITGAHGPVTYELEIGDHDVVEDAVGAGSVIVGEFTLPHLGDSGKTVTVEADIRERHDRTKVKRKLRYLGAALPPTRAAPPPQAAPEPAAEPPALPAAAAPAPANPPSAAPPPPPAGAAQDSADPATRARTVRRRSARRGRQGGVRSRGSRPARGGKPDRRSPRRKSRKKKRGARTAPLFDGVPEPGAGNYLSGRSGGHASVNAIAPPAATLVAARTAPGDGGLSAAVLVPGLMGVAALMLTGIAVHRRRRLR